MSGWWENSETLTLFKKTKCLPTRSNADIIYRTITVNLTSVGVAPLVLLAVLHWGPVGRVPQHIVTWWQAVILWVWNENTKRSTTETHLGVIGATAFPLLTTGRHLRVVSPERSVWDGELDTLLLWLEDICASSNEGEGDGLSSTRSYRTTRSVRLVCWWGYWIPKPRNVQLLCHHSVCMLKQMCRKTYPAMTKM